MIFIIIGYCDLSPKTTWFTQTAILWFFSCISTVYTVLLIDFHCRWVQHEMNSLLQQRENQWTVNIAAIWMCLTVIFCVSVLDPFSLPEYKPLDLIQSVIFSTFTIIHYTVLRIYFSLAVTHICLRVLSRKKLSFFSFLTHRLITTLASQLISPHRDRCLTLSLISGRSARSSLCRVFFLSHSQFSGFTCCSVTNSNDVGHWTIQSICRKSALLLSDVTDLF